MSNFINFSLTVTILWTKPSRMAQRGNLAGASGVIWPVRSGSLCWIGRIAKRVVPSWLSSQPLAVTLRHNLPSRGWFTLRKCLLICCLSLVTWLKGEVRSGVGREKAVPSLRWAVSEAVSVWFVATGANGETPSWKTCGSWASGSCGSCFVVCFAADESQAINK